MATLIDLADHQRLDIDLLLANRDIRIVVCCGSGGVGKTTTAAALALRAAEVHGRRTVVLTIDPARRLAQSLGLTGREVFDIEGINDSISGERRVRVRATAADGAKREFEAKVRVDTPQEAEYFRNGGILPYVVRQLAAGKA